MKNESIPANGEKPCGCCGRFHRKLILVNGVYVGQSCGEQIELYMKHPNITDIVWRGYERQYEKVSRMFKTS